MVQLATLENLCRERGGDLDYNSEKAGEAFIADMGDGRVVTFRRCPDTNFPYIDLDDWCNDKGAAMLL